MRTRTTTYGPRRGRERRRDRRSQQNARSILRDIEAERAIAVLRDVLFDLEGRAAGRLILPAEAHEQVTARDADGLQPESIACVWQTSSLLKPCSPMRPFSIAVRRFTARCLFN